MLKVAGYKLLIKRSKVEGQLEVNKEAMFKDAEANTLKSLGFEIPVSAEQTKQYKVATEEGVIVDIGEMAWKSKDLGYGTDGWMPWAKVGDRVLFARYCGKDVQDPEVPGADGLYYIINDVDLQCRIEGVN